MATIIRIPRKSGTMPMFRGDEHLRINPITNMGEIDFAVTVRTNGAEYFIKPDGAIVAHATGSYSPAVGRYGVGTSGPATFATFYSGATINLDGSRTVACIFSDIDVTGVTQGCGIDSYSLSAYNATEKLGYSISGVADNASTLDGPKGQSGIALWGVTRGGTLTTAFNGQLGTEGSISSSGANSYTGPVFTRSYSTGLRYLIVGFNRRWSDAELQWYSETPQRFHELMFGKSTRTISLPAAAPPAGGGRKNPFAWPLQGPLAGPLGNL